jgi:hypothetical protein
MYVYLYEKIVALFGEQIYCPSDEYNVDYFEALELRQSSFFKVPFSKGLPFVHSIKNSDLKRQKDWFLGLEKPDGISQSKYDADLADYAYAFDKAIQDGKDLVFVLS